MAYAVYEKDGGLLEWTQLEIQELCRLVQLYGTTNWPIITTSFERFSAKLCELRWNVLHLDALEKARKPVPASKEYTDWEVAVMLRGVEAWSSAGTTQCHMHAVLASWLPGRTANGVKQAIKNHIKKDGGAQARARAAQQGWPETLIGVLSVWPGMTPLDQMCMQHTAAESAQQILQEVATAATAVSSAAKAKKRKRSTTSDIPNQPPTGTPAAAAAGSNVHINFTAASRDTFTLASAAAINAAPSCNSSFLYLQFGLLPVGSCNTAGSPDSSYSSLGSTGSVSTAVPCAVALGGSPPGYIVCPAQSFASPAYGALPVQVAPEATLAGHQLYSGSCTAAAGAAEIISPYRQQESLTIDIANQDEQYANLRAKRQRSGLSAAPSSACPPSHQAAYAWKGNGSLQGQTIVIGATGHSNEQQEPHAPASHCGPHPALQQAYNTAEPACSLMLQSAQAYSADVNGPMPYLQQQQQGGSWEGGYTSLTLAEQSSGVEHHQQPTIQSMATGQDYPQVCTPLGAAPTLIPANAESSLDDIDELLGLLPADNKGHCWQLAFPWEQDQLFQQWLDRIPVEELISW